MSFLPALVDGLCIGFVYGLAAMGLTLIFGVLRVVNLAHGSMITLGMFGLYLLSTHLNLNPYLALMLVAVLGLGSGMLIYYLALHRTMDAPHLSSLLATFAVNMIIVGIGTATFSTSARNLDFALGSFNYGEGAISGQRLVAVFATLGVTSGLYLFLAYTSTGKYIRAVANNRYAAELVGIPSTSILALSFGLGTMLAAIAGGLIATFLPFTILAGGVYELKSFVICVLGGLGNPLGALLGGLILGVLEGFLPFFLPNLPNTWIPVLEFGLFVVILLFRPSGLLGAKQ
jgi:branched-subunit amino acid ABC-type transport system permease component